MDPLVVPPLVWRGRVRGKRDMGEPWMVFRTSMAPRDLVPWPEGETGSRGSSGSSGRRWLVLGIVPFVIAIAALLYFRPWW